MTASDQPQTRTVLTILWVLAFAGAALLAGGYAVHVLSAIVSDVRVGAASISLHPREAVLAPLAVAMGCFALMGMLPNPEIRLRPSRRSARARRSNAIATRLFACAVAATLATSVAAPLAAMAIGTAVTERGYRACPPPSPNRFGLRQWARTPDACRADLR